MYVPPLNEVFVGDTARTTVFGLNGSTGLVENTIKVAWDPQGLAYDSRDGTLLVATGAAVAVVDLTTLSVRGWVNGTGGSALLYDPGNGFAYVADFNNGIVRALNVTTRQIVANISVGAAPDALALDAPDNLLYVANFVYFSVSIINTSSNRILVNQVKLGAGQPSCLTFDPANGYMYVGNQISGNVSILVAATHTFVGTGVKVGGDCLAMTFDPANRNVYIGNAGAGIAAINGTTLNGSGIYDPNSPEGLAYDSRDNSVYAVNFGTNTITSFNASTGTLVIANAPLTPTFLRATYDPLNGDVYVATPDPGFLCLTPGSLTVINASSIPQVVAKIPVGYGPEATVLDSKSGLLFVANSCSNNVTIVNGTTQRTVGAGVPVGSGPIALGYDPVRDRIIVANGYSHNLTVLNGSTGAIVAANVSVGPQPDGVAIDPVNGRIYVADFGSGNLTVLNGTTYKRARSDIPVGGCPEGVVYDPNGGLIVSINSCTGNLTVLNGNSGGYVNHSVSAGVGPVAAALDPAQNLLYVADAAGGTVAIVNLTTLAMEGAPIPVNSDPQGVAYVPGTSQVEVSDFLSGTVSILATIPIVESFSVYPSTVEAGQAVQFVVMASEAGAPPLTVAYGGLPVGCGTINVTNLRCDVGQAGAYRVRVTVTDPRGFTAWAYAAVVATPALGNASLSVSPSQLDLGGSVSLRTTISGSPENLSYAYSGLPSGCRSANASVLSCTPSSVGTFGLLVQVTDPLGARAAAAGGLVVVPPPSVVAFVANPATLLVGGRMVFAIESSGGTAPYNYAYQGLPAGCATANSSEIVCVPTAPGSFAVRAIVTDSFGEMSAATATVIIKNSTSAPLSILAFFAAPSTLLVGENTTIVAVVTGGSGGDSFAYGGLPPGCVSSNNSEIGCRPTAPGSYNLTVVVTDRSGDSLANSSTLTSLPDLTPGKAPAPSLGVPWPIVAGIGALVGFLGALGGFAVARRRYARPQTAGQPRN